MEWTPGQELFLSKIEHQCNAHIELNAHQYSHFSRLSIRFHIPILVLSAANALAAVGLNAFIPQKYVSVINAVLSAGTGVIGSIVIYLKYSDKAANAMSAGFLFKLLAIKISKELTLERTSRATSGHLFLADCFEQFNNALKSGNPIRKEVPNFLSFSSKNLKHPSGKFSKIASRLTQIETMFGDSAHVSDPLPDLNEQDPVPLEIPTKVQDVESGAPDSSDTQL